MEDPELLNLTSYLTNSDIFKIINFSNVKINIKSENSKVNHLVNVCNKITEKNILNLEKDENLYDKDLFYTIRQLALKEQGMVENQYRKVIYPYLLGINPLKYKSKENNSNNDSDFIIIDSSTRRNYIKVKYPSLHRLSNSIKDHIEISKSSIYKNIIKVDTYRSKINHYLKNKEFHSTNTCLKQLLHLTVNNLSDMIDNRYHYFQGYHDFILLFLMLFEENDDLLYVFGQRFTEFYLKESSNSKEDHKNFNFYIEMKLISVVVRLYNEDIGNEVNSVFEDGFFFVTSWLITFFTHNMNDLKSQYRIIDYIITSSPNTIYFLSATIIVEEYKKFMEISRSETTCHKEISFEEIFLYFQEIDFNKYDFDSVITLCENFKKRVFSNSTFSLLDYVNLNNEDLFKYPRFVIRNDVDVCYLLCNTSFSLYDYTKPIENEVFYSKSLFLYENFRKNMFLFSLIFLTGYGIKYFMKE